MTTFNTQLLDGTAAAAGDSTGVLWLERRQMLIDQNTYAELWPALTPFLSGLMQSAQTRSDLTDPIFKMWSRN
jgi:hypothetical protein